MNQVLPNGKMTGLVAVGEEVAIQVSVVLGGAEHKISIPLSAWQQQYLYGRLKPTEVNE